MIAYYLSIILLASFFYPRWAYSSHAASPEQPQQDFSIYLPLVLNKYPPTNIFGVQMYELNAAHGIDQMSAAKVTWTRRVVDWSAIEPTEGVRNWSAAFDQELVTARQYNIRTVLIIEHTPAWALKPGYSCGAVAQGKFTALGNFLYDLVLRYSAAPYFIEYYELWNEPEVVGGLGCWGDPNDLLYDGGAYYGQMIKSVAPRIKAASAKAQVLVGGLLLDCDPNNPPAGVPCVGLHFFEGILAAGSGPYFDGVAFHAYDYYTGLGTYGNGNWHAYWNTTGPVPIVKANYLKGVLSAYGYPQKYLINTENAILYGPNYQHITCVDYAPPEVEITKLYYIIHSYTQALSQDWRANIWYSVFGVRCSGLLETNLEPKPAYRAYTYTADRVGYAQFIRSVSEYTGVMGYEFLTSTNRIWVLWSKDGADHTIDLPSIPVAIDRIEVDGNPAPEAPASTSTITLAVRFLYFTP